MNSGDTEEIGGILDALRKLSGMELLWKNSAGASAPGLPLRHCLHENPFCRRIKKDKILIRKCCENDCVLIPARASRTKGPFVNECHAGVRELVVPVFSDDGALLGFLLAGPLRDIGGGALRAVEKIMGLTARRVAEILEKSRREELKKQIRDPRMQKAADFISKNLKSRISAADVARAACLSESRFLHIFKERTGEGFSEFLRRKRIEAAMSMLANGGMGIFETAVECGYRDQAYFGKVFREIVGISPGKYRKKHIGRARP